MLFVSGTRDQRIAAIASRQRGRIAARQMHAAGISPHQIHGLVRRHGLQRIHTAVYVVGHAGPVELGRETAALLAVGDDALLGCHAAAALWELRPSPPGDEPIDVIVMKAHGVKRAGIRARRTRHLHPTERRVHNGLPVTSPARTLLDIAPLVSLDELEQAIDTALWRKLVRIPDIEAVLDRHPMRVGAKRLRGLIEIRKGGALSRSHPERRLRDLIRASRLPQPQMNAPLLGYKIDFLWQRERLIVEVDGYDFHGGRAQFEADRRRDATLEAAGWTVIRFTARQVEREPFAVIAHIAQALTWAAARQAA